MAKGTQKTNWALLIGHGMAVDRLIGQRHWTKFHMETK